MDALAFAVLSIAFMMIANGADNKFGQVCLTLTACLLAASSFLILPWGVVFYG